MNENPESLPQVAPSPKKPKALQILLGLGLGILPGIIALLARKSDAVIVLFLLSVTLWPVAAIVLAIIPASRRFGLGMLLGVGFAFIVLLAVCGGMNTSGFH